MTLDWLAVGFSEDDGRRLDRLATGEEEFTLGQLLGLWQQWVTELETGQLWVREDYLSALDSRDDLDAVLPLVPLDLRARTFEIADDLDQRFRSATAPGALLAEPLEGCRWWRLRVPISNAQRLFLFGYIDR
jgi:hypothetical protein